MILPPNSSRTTIITRATNSSFSQTFEIWKVLVPTLIAVAASIAIGTAIYRCYRSGYSSYAFTAHPVPQQIMNPDPVSTAPQMSESNPHVTPYTVRGSNWNRNGIDEPPSWSAVPQAGEVAVPAVSHTADYQSRRTSEPWPNNALYPNPPPGVGHEEIIPRIEQPQIPSAWPTNSLYPDPPSAHIPPTDRPNHDTTPSVSNTDRPPSYELSLEQAQTPIVRQL